MKELIETNYSIGQVVRHKYLDFRGVIFDVDPEFNNTEEWYHSSVLLNSGSTSKITPLKSRYLCLTTCPME